MMNYFLKHKGRDNKKNDNLKYMNRSIKVKKGNHPNIQIKRKYKVSENLKGNTIFIPVISLSKKSSLCGWQKLTITPDIEYFDRCDNIAALCGEVGDITVIDLDIKKDNSDVEDGVEVFEKFLDTVREEYKEWFDDNGKLKTLTQKSGSGGYHYFFNYAKVPNSRQLNNSGIDIINRNYIMLSPSKFYNEKTKKTGKYTIYNDYPIIDLPEWIFSWIMGIVNPVPSIPKQIKEISPTIKRGDRSIGFRFIYTENQIWEILDKFPIKYCEELMRWFRITTALRTENLYEIFDKYSQRCANKYDKLKNDYIWESLDINSFDINYLVWQYNTFINKEKQIGYFEKYRVYEPIQRPIILKGEIIKINERYIKSGLYEGEEIVICISGTGSGKTTSMAEYCKDKDSKILSIVSRTNMASQHVISFGRAGVKMVSYKDDMVQIDNDNVAIQIDSLTKKFVTKIDFSEYILYLDEGNSLIEFLLDSDTLKHHRISTYQKLFKVVKTAKKIVISDADMTDLVFKFIKSIRGTDKYKLIMNEYKHYENIDAYRYTKLAEIIKSIKKSIIDDKKVFVCFDTVDGLYSVYFEIRKWYVDNFGETDIFQIHTADSNPIVENADKIWENKHVFISPVVIYGIDWNPGYKVDVYVFNQKKVILTPTNSVQQLSRCRNINTVHYYFGEKIRTNKSNYKSVDEVKEYYKRSVKEFEYIFKDICALEVDPNTGDYIIRDSLLAELRYQQEYYRNVFMTGSIYHFEDILRNKGFNIRLEPRIIEAKQNKGGKEINIETICGSKELKEKLENEKVKKNGINAETLRYMLKRLNVNDIELVRDIIKTKSKFYEHINVCDMMKAQKENNSLINKEIESDEMNRIITSTHAVIALCWSIEKILDIGRFEIELDETAITTEGYYGKILATTDQDISTLFNIQKQYNIIAEVRDTTDKDIKEVVKKMRWYDLYGVLIKLYRRIGGKDLIITEKVNRQIDRGSKYQFKMSSSRKINMEYLRRHMEIYRYRDPTYSRIDRDIMKYVGVNKYGEYLFD